MSHNFYAELHVPKHSLHSLHSLLAPKAGTEEEFLRANKRLLDACIIFHNLLPGATRLNPNLEFGQTKNRSAKSNFLIVFRQFSMKFWLRWRVYWLEEKVKTRCIPRTRMQSRRTLFVKQVNWTFLCMLPLLPYQCTVDCGMWKRVECEVWSAKWKVWSVQCGVKMWSVKCGV